MKKLIRILILLCSFMVLFSCDFFSIYMNPYGIYSIIYDGNGDIKGTVPVDNNLYFENEEVVILDNSTLYREAYYYICGWNT